MDEAILWAFDVVARIFMEQRCKEGVGKDVLRGLPDGGGAKPLTEGAAVGALVGLAVGYLLVACRDDHRAEVQWAV